MKFSRPELKAAGWPLAEGVYEGIAASGMTVVLHFGDIDNLSDVFKAGHPSDATRKRVILKSVTG
jgi:hypothetical protein